MKCIKLIALFAVISFGATSCSMGGGHTRCAAYTINEPVNDPVEEEGQLNKEYKEQDLVY